jgi:hypothetical protein
MLGSERFLLFYQFAQSIFFPQSSILTDPIIIAFIRHNHIWEDFFFLALPWVRFIMTINRTRGKSFLIITLSRVAKGLCFKGWEILSTLFSFPLVKSGSDRFYQFHNFTRSIFFLLRIFIVIHCRDTKILCTSLNFPPFKSSSDRFYQLHNFTRNRRMGRRNDCILIQVIRIILIAYIRDDSVLFTFVVVSLTTAMKNQLRGIKLLTIGSEGCMEFTE